MLRAAVSSGLLLLALTSLAIFTAFAIVFYTSRPSMTVGESSQGKDTDVAILNIG